MLSQRPAVKSEVGVGPIDWSNDMTKLDLKKELKHLYHASPKEVVRVEVPALQFLMIDGQGDPNTSREYAEAVEALFSVSYTAKFLLKRGPSGVDYAVMPLEGLWWSDDWASFVTTRRRDWKWTMMVVQPDFVDEALIQTAIAAAQRKKALTALSKLRLERFTEGSCCQTLHVGPFTSEGATIARLHEVILAAGSLRGKHHEIYLSDIRRAAPERWKTVIRQPMTPVDSIATQA